MLPIRKTHPLTKPVTSSLIDLPAPFNLSYWWNMGSLISLFLVIQIATGLFLAMHYCPNIELAFPSVMHISRDVNYGWLIRSTHANGASAFFVLIYLHIGRGLYFGSFKNQETWNIGIIMLLLSMATAFVGYVLVWGQMSFWGATVITNLLSAIPYIGTSVVEWIWGGFAISNATLNRFFIFHFILPFIIAAMTAVHLLMLHQSGSNNPLGLNSNFNKIPFHPFYSYKDLLGVAAAITPLTLLVLLSPNMFSDPDNFTPANPMVTPIHIKPEWYFLWAYAILRSIPNKLGGVVAMFAAILILFTIPSLWAYNYTTLSFYPPAQVMFWTMIANMLLLTWIGARPAEAPYIFLGQIFTSTYFMVIPAIPIAAYIWQTMIKPWKTFLPS